MKKNKQYFPILIDLDTFPVIVIGGGKVALRKVNNLLDFGCEIKVIAPELCEELLSLKAEEKIFTEEREYKYGDLEGFRLVFCCTDNPAVNFDVFLDALKAGCLINVADEPQMCNFITPSIIKRGDFIVSLSSMGKAPFFIKKQREELEELYTSVYAEIIELAGQFRKKLYGLSESRTDSEIQLAIEKFLAVNWKDIVEKQGIEEAYKIMESSIKE